MPLRSQLLRDRVVSKSVGDRPAELARIDLAERGQVIPRDFICSVERDVLAAALAADSTLPSTQLPQLPPN